MKLFNIHFKVFIGFAIALAGIGFFLYTTYINSQLSITDSQQINHELKIMKLSENMMMGVQDMESSYRGYVITGDTSYLKSANEAFKSLPENLFELNNVTREDSDQFRISMELSNAINSKIDFAKDIIEKRKQNKFDQALSMIKTNKGMVLMNQVKENISLLELKGRHVLNESNLKKELIATETKRNFIVLSLVLFFQLTLVYLIIAKDLNKKERNQKEILDANKRIHDLYDQAPCGYLSINKNGVIVEINQTALNWLGYQYEEIRGIKKLSDLSPLSYRLTLDNLLSRGSISKSEIELTNKSGENIPVLIDTKINYGSNNEIIYIRTALTEIKGRKEAEARVHYLAALINNTNDSIISTDKNFKIKSWNLGAEKMYGIPSEETIGNSLFDCLQLPTSFEHQNEIWLSLLSTGKWVFESSYLTKNKKKIFVRNAVSIFNQNKELNFILIINSQDITAQKEHESILRRFNIDLQNQVQERTVQISNILNRISEGFISFDSNYDIIYVNTYTANLVGLPIDQLIGLNYLKFFENIPNSVIINKIKIAIEENVITEIEDYSEYFKKWFHGKVYPSESIVSIFFQDITSKKESELKLIENEKKYRLLFQNNPLPMWIIEIENFTILDVNEAAIKHYGYSYNEFIGKPVLELRPEAERVKYIDYLKSNRGENYNAGIWTHIKKNGEKIKVDILAYSMDYEGKKSQLIISNDITEKIIFQEELEKSRDQLRNLSSHLEKIREEERTSIAREIHDELGQQLTGLKMDASWVARRLKEKNADNSLDDKIQGMIILIDDTVKTVRKIASELRPGILDDLGLIAALDWQSKEFEKRTGIKCNFSSDQIDHHFDKNMSTGIFRIYQEALTNVARHANARSVSSSIVVNNDEMVEINIEDDGIGMQDDPSSKHTLGIVGMKERALMLNGKLLIISQIGSGTRVNLKVPFQN